MTTADLDRALTLIDIGLCLADFVIVTYLLATRERPARKPSRAAIAWKAYRKRRGLAASRIMVEHQRRT